ncbi:Transcriptional regulator, TetR family [[Actinomadura] parvosata subsp. kistnae]|nr:Transcriptional regulator, TetR family [Actinomadura parvosata subsp. kistnae]
MTTTSRRVPTGERAARKRAAIVRAARRQFLEHGFGAGMDHIAAEAGVSKVTVYNHFAGKEELFTEVVSDALEQALGQTMRAMNERLRTGDDLRDVLCATAREWVEGIAQPDVLALRALITAEARRFPELGRLWRRHGPTASPSRWPPRWPRATTSTSPGWSWRSSSSTRWCSTRTSCTAPTATGSTPGSPTSSSPPGSTCS